MNHCLLQYINHYSVLNTWTFDIKMTRLVTSSFSPSYIKLNVPIGVTANYNENNINCHK